MDAGLDQDQTILAILVLTIALQVLTNGDGLLDQVVEILGNLGSQTMGTEDTNNLVTSDRLDLTNTMAITEDDTNLTGSDTLATQLANQVNSLIIGGLQPAGSTAVVGEGGSGDTLTK